MSLDAKTPDAAAEAGAASGAPVMPMRHGHSTPIRHLARCSGIDYHCIPGTGFIVSQW
jgi:hypothetical protein